MKYSERTLLDGKRILVTGAARGLGFDCARLLVSQGAHLVIADILTQEGNEAVAHFKEVGATVEFVPVDLSMTDSIQVCAKEAANYLGGIDGLVNCAAIATGVGGKLMEDIEITDWDRVFEVNVRGTWLMTKACLPWLKKSEHGRVVNIASDTALWGAPKLMHYVASKGAVISMTRSLARELGAHDICVNVVAPGLTRVEATEYVPQERYDLYKDGRAIKREQVPEDVSSVISFLLSDSASYISGQTLAVNGGFVMP